MRAASVRQGEVLAGRYRVDRVIGTGAMGVVVAAVDLQARELRAIKLMTPGALDDREAVARFDREARACMKLSGEHVARVFEMGRLDSGVPFMVMEHLDGRDLREVLDERGTLRVGEALTFMLQICEALAEAHALGIVHRDLKPANLFVVGGPGQAPSIKVLDFGVSRILGDAGSTGDTTRSDMMIGSPHYMSPEQMRSSHDVDPRTDVWSLGVVVYQLLTGCLPFDGHGLAQIISAVLAGDPAPPSSLLPDVPPALDAAILRCLESDPDRRWASVIELAAALAPFAPPQAAPSLERLLGVPAAARRKRPAEPPEPEPEPEIKPKPAPRPGPRRIPTALLIAAAFALGCAIAGLLLRLR